MAMLKTTALFVWRFPRNLPGLAAAFTFRGKKDSQGVRAVKARTGVSLGGCIILHEGYSGTSLKHEKGHQKQPLLFGHLYLLAVGFPPAVCNNLWDRLFYKNWPSGDRVKRYFSRYPEKWADKPGGVTRWA
jgi:hypothetical protein